MYRIAICDDDELFLELVYETLQRYCSKQGIGVYIQKYNNTLTLSEDIENGKLFEAYILDIEMKCYSGLEIAKMIEARSSMPYIIFLTSYSSYAVEACGMRIFRYVLKEKMEQQFPMVMDALFAQLKIMENNDNYIMRNIRKYVKFPQRSIIYIYKESKNAVFVLTNNGRETERITLQEVYRKLNSRELIFLDRGIIVNIYHVQKILGRQISMAEGHMITTSKMGIEELKQALNRYWGSVL